MLFHDYLQQINAQKCFSLIFLSLTKLQKIQVKVKHRCIYKYFQIFQSIK